MPERRPRQSTSLLTRTNLILGVSATVLAAIASVALYSFVVEPISRQSAEDEAALLVLSAQTWVELPPESRPYFELEMAETHDLIISEARQELPVVDTAPDYFSLLQDALAQRLELTQIDLLVDEDLYWVDVPMGGYQLQIGFSPEREDIQPLYSAIVIVVFGAAIVFLTSLFIVQRIARPLVKIADQAEHFRGLGEMEPLPESGPAELASLARNFNTMAREISVLLANRTTLLAGISHDLRTPLTRMRLALALLPEDVDASLVERFERNLQGMDELIADALTFARGTSESAHEVELKSFVAEIVRSFEGAEFHTHPDVSDDYSLELAPSAFQRVLLNLIGNASNYGQRVVVKLRTNRVVVEDDGPGVPAEHRTQIFQPFFRLDESRNTHTGGSGLGLAIVAQLCQAHGWQVEVSDAKIGGARFTLRF